MIKNRIINVNQKVINLVMDIEMSPAISFETMAVQIASMGKNEVIGKICHFHGRFKLDFTSDYLKGLSVDRLRHILMAAVMTNSR